MGFDVDGERQSSPTDSRQLDGSSVGLRSRRLGVQFPLSLQGEVRTLPQARGRSGFPPKYFPTPALTVPSEHARMRAA